MDITHQYRNYNISILLPILYMMHWRHPWVERWVRGEDPSLNDHGGQFDAVHKMTGCPVHTSTGRRRMLAFTGGPHAAYTSSRRSHQVRRYDGTGLPGRVTRRNAPSTSRRHPRRPRPPSPLVGRICDGLMDPKPCEECIIDHVACTKLQVAPHATPSIPHRPPRPHSSTTPTMPACRLASSLNALRFSPPLPMARPLRRGLTDTRPTSPSGPSWTETSSTP